MSKLLQFVSIWEFLLRYTVIAGVIVAILGVTCCFSAKMFSKNNADKNYSRLIIAGIVLILLGMIIMVLPIEATLYRG